MESPRNCSKLLYEPFFEQVNYRFENMLNPVVTCDLNRCNFCNLLSARFSPSSVKMSHITPNCPENQYKECRGKAATENQKRTIPVIWLKGHGWYDFIDLLYLGAHTIRPCSCWSDFPFRTIHVCCSNNYCYSVTFLTLPNNKLFFNTHHVLLVFVHIFYNPSMFYIIRGATQTFFLMVASFVDSV